MLLTAAAAWQAGMTWDDAIESIALHDELALLRHGAADYAAAVKSIVVLNAYYGVVPEAVGHLVNCMLGFEPAWDVGTAPAVFVVRHLVVVGFALLGTAVLTHTVWRVGRSRVAAAAMPALLLGLPMFGGHAAINMKDTPVACGLAILACGLVRALHALRLERRDGGAAWLALLGSFVAVGTRAGTVALVPVLGGAVLLAALLGHGRRAMAPLLRCAAGALAGVALVLATNPVAWFAPLRWLVESVRIAAAYPAYQGVVLLGGLKVSAQATPWWYVPAWLGVQIPLEMMVLAGIGLAGWRWRVWRGASLTWFPFVMLGAVIPLLVVLSGANLYNALRQLLFMVPPLALAACWGVARLAATWPRAAVALVAVMVGQCAAWVPYQYAYLNPVGLALGGSRNFEGDYWGISGREATRRLQALGAIRPIVGPGGTGGPYGAGGQDDTPDFDAYYAFGYGGRIGLLGQPTTPPGCRRAFVIARMGMRLGEGFMCATPGGR